MAAEKCSGPGSNLLWAGEFGKPGVDLIVERDSAAGEELRFIDEAAVFHGDSLASSHVSAVMQDLDSACDENSVAAMSLSLG
jgi:hypothetical protein